jgi:hypothetical protein
MVPLICSTLTPAVLLLLLLLVVNLQMSRCRKLLEHVAAHAPRQCLGRQLYLVVGRHIMQSQHTLRQAGVSRDCHVRLLSR